MAHKVGDIMTPEVITIDVDAGLDEAQALMDAEDVRRLPVVDEDGDLVGILSWGDLREATSVEAAQTPLPPELGQLGAVFGALARGGPLAMMPYTLKVE